MAMVVANSLLQERGARSRVGAATRIRIGGATCPLRSAQRDLNRGGIATTRGLANN